jgi:hypothetical protein
VNGHAGAGAATVLAAAIFTSKVGWNLPLLGVVVAASLLLALTVSEAWNRRRGR